MLGLWTGGVLEGEADDCSCALPLRIKAAIPCCKEICAAVPAQLADVLQITMPSEQWCHEEPGIAPRILYMAAGGLQQQCYGMTVCRASDLGRQGSRRAR